MKTLPINNLATTRLIDMLKSNTTQYPPLDKAQERAMIEKYRNDRDKLNQLLYLHNVRLVFKMVKRYSSKSKDFDAMVSDCLYGLAIACLKFDIDAGTKFSTYATHWIFKYCVSGFYSKESKLDRVTLSLDVPSLRSKTNDENGSALENYVNEYIDPSTVLPKTVVLQLSANELSYICKDLLKHLEADTSLSATDKLVFKGVVIDRERTKDIADKYAMTVKEVKEVRSKILTKFRDILSQQYNVHSFSDI